MGKRKIEDILDICLEDFKKGQSIDEILSRYPDYREELESLLGMASKIESLPKPKPRENAMFTALMKAGKHLPSKKEEVRRFGFGWIFNAPPVWAKAMAAVLILTLVTWTTVNASVGALPGDLLYPVKLATEKIKIMLTVQSEGKAELRLTFSDNRMQELLAQHKETGVIDNALIAAMLDEASLALNNISLLPEEKQPVFFTKVNHFNSYQKETLQSLRPHVSGEQTKVLDEAIEICGNRGQWMKKMKKQGVYNSWDKSSCCNWH